MGVGVGSRKLAPRRPFHCGRRAGGRRGRGRPGGAVLPHPPSRAGWLNGCAHRRRRFRPERLGATGSPHAGGVSWHRHLAHRRGRLGHHGGATLAFQHRRSAAGQRHCHSLHAICTDLGLRPALGRTFQPGGDQRVLAEARHQRIACTGLHPGATAGRRGGGVAGQCHVRSARAAGLDPSARRQRPVVG